MNVTRATRLLLACLLLAACKQDDGDDAQPTLTREELMDPETCKDCHPKHYREWKSSMHAYAAEDPVFLAMNALGQEETDGGLGDFCVKCHAPMALEEGATTDGTNLDEVPEHLKGVTCYFCHNAVDVIGEHNAEIVLANDTTMRGSIANPVQPSAHGVASSRFHDSYDPQSSKLCGGCHDIVTPSGVHLERTYAEYKASVIGNPDSPGFLSCSGCHMRGRPGLAAMDPDSPVATRTVHEHLWPGVDVALTEWPDRELQRAAVEECALAVGTKSYGIEQRSPIEYAVTVETNAGHNQPSGAAQDRRLWIELKAYDANGELICTSRAVPDDEAVASFRDPQPCMVSSGPSLFRDVIYDASGEETHKFWEAAPSDLFPDGYVNVALPPATVDLSTPHTVETVYTILPEPARIEVRMRMRPMDFDVLQELVDSGHLDAAVLDELPTFTLNGTQGVWEDGRYTATGTFDCDSYVCEIDPTAPGCE